MELVKFHLLDMEENLPSIKQGLEAVKFHLLDMEENLPSIKQGLEAKLDALVMRDLYSKYKTAPTEEEREQARKEYLDRRGVSEKFRW